MSRLPADVVALGVRPSLSNETNTMKRELELIRKMLLAIEELAWI